MDSAFPKVRGVDSRFRGNDCGLERLFLAYATTTGVRGARWAVYSGEAARKHKTDLARLALK